MTDEQLIFLISQPRSGSTLLQAILGGHPEIHTCSEPWIALPFIYALREEGSEFDFNSSSSKIAIRSFFSESEISEEFYHSALNSFLTSLYSKALSNSGKSFFLDKTPRYYEISSDLITVFPNAKFIVLVRHPLSVLNSILKTWVKDEIDILYYYSRDLLAAPRELTNFVSTHKENVCLVNYEALVCSPETEIKIICEYLGIDYLEEIINYNSDVNWVYGDKNFKEKNTPDGKSIDGWKTQLGNKRHANLSYYYLRELGEELVNSLGYDFNSALSCIKKFNPDESDYKTWKTLVHNKYIVSIDEQRLLVRKKLQGNFLRALYEKITT